MAGRFWIILMVIGAFGQCWADSYKANGVVRDGNNKHPLANVTVMAPGTTISTVTNSDGQFSLIIPDTLSQLKFSHLGYHNQFVDIAELEKTHLVKLQRASKALSEITVLGANPRSLVEEALSKIKDNYPRDPQCFNAFYRETVQRGKRYMAVSEGMMDVRKTDYRGRNISGDRVSVRKGRKLISPNPSDTLAVKMQGGPYLAVMLDLVKNPDLILDEKDLDCYEYSFDGTAMIDDRLHFKVRFTPKVIRSYALLEGTLYIDANTMAFTRAEFALDLSDREKATESILRKKPRGLRFKLEKVAFKVAYVTENGVTTLHYLQNEIKFKCDWKRRLFSSSYNVVTEMVAVDRDGDFCQPGNMGPRFSSRDVFSDKVQSLYDPTFWSHYNIIEPSESLEKALPKLRKIE